MVYKPLAESLDAQDLVDRISETVHIDEYAPKMGQEDDIIVASFRVFGKQPAYDLENFLEKGYDWILDAETSAGEISDGDYLVFVEAERRTSFPRKFMAMIEDLKNLTNVANWQMIYYTTQLDERRAKPQPLTQNNLAGIPLSPRSYREMKASSNVLEGMLNIARVPRNSRDTSGFKPYQRKSRS